MRTSIIALALTTAAALAGPLTPPPGAPSPTNKTLQQVEPRTPLTGGTGTGITISQPGSYYLTEPVNITTVAAGIRITANQVTLDLNGFTVQGNAVGTVGISISAPAFQGHVLVRNGHVDGFTDDGVSTSSSGIRASFDSIVVSNCLRGFDLLSAGLVTNCTAHDNTDDGFESFNQTVFLNCLAYSNGQDGFDIDEGVISHCGSSTNNAAGFRIGFTIDTGQLAQAVDCSSRSNQVGFVTAGPASLVRCSAYRSFGIGFDIGPDGILTDCIAQACNASGFDTDFGATLRNCVAVSNQAFGFALGPANTADACVARSNTLDGFFTSDNAVLSHCVARSNAGGGFQTGAASNLSYCTASSNAADGFNLGFDNRVTNCNADAHITVGSAGFRGNSDTVIDSCTATDNDIGFIFSTGGIGIRNTAGGNTTNFNITGANYGAVVTAAGPITSTNPWANIAY